MEKKEAIREYCLGLAVDIARGKGEPVDIDTVIEAAKKLEEYITGIVYPVSTITTNVGSWDKVC